MVPGSIHPFVVRADDLRERRERLRAREDAERNGFSLLAGNPVPNTPGLPSLESYAAQGYTILTF